VTATRPFVDEPVVDLEHAASVAAEAAAAWGLPAPELLRRGMNAIYACGDVVVRVGRASAPAALSHDLVTTLLGRGIATVSPIPGLAEDRRGFAVTAWRRVVPVDRPIDWEAVGATVAAVHAVDRSDLPCGYPLPDPTAFPWWDFDAVLEETAAHIDARALAAIRRVVEEGRWWTEGVGVGATVCHGDVHPGNVLVADDGPLLIDWDLMCVAAPAWDHAMLTTYSARWGGPPGVYEAFAAGYGTSFEDDELTQTIAKLRNVAATLMRVRAGLRDPAAAAEARRRLRFWAGDPDAPVWRAQ
jgi:aminoglycoside phosphotransferase (APT) family kinase protein